MPDLGTFGVRLYWQVYDSMRREFYAYIRRRLDEEREGKGKLKAADIAAQWEYLSNPFKVGGTYPPVLKGLLYEVLYFTTRYRDIMKEEKTIRFFPISETQGRVYDFMELRLVKEKKMHRFIEVKSRRPEGNDLRKLEEEAKELQDTFGIRLAVYFPRPDLPDEYPEIISDWDHLTLPRD